MIVSRTFQVSVVEIDVWVLWTLSTPEIKTHWICQSAFTHCERTYERDIDVKSALMERWRLRAEVVASPLAVTRVI